MPFATFKQTVPSVALATALLGGVAHAATEPLVVTFASGAYETTTYDLPAPFASAKADPGSYTTSMGASGTVTLDVSGRTGSEVQKYGILDVNVTDGIFKDTEFDEGSVEAAIDEDGELSAFEMVLSWFGLFSAKDGGRSLEVSSTDGTRAIYSNEYAAADECDSPCTVMASASTSVVPTFSADGPLEFARASADPSVVPLPAGVPLLAAGLLSFAALRRKRRT